MTTFDHLEYGIYMIGSATSKTAVIKYCTFNLNHTGAYFSGIIGLNFTNNYLYPQQGAIPINDTYRCGLYLDGCTGYKIEDNHFESNTLPVNNNKLIGMIVNNSGSDDNCIKNNFFTKVDYGIHAQGTNRSYDGRTGLEIRCNNFENCIIDISVYSIKSPGGIRTNQGRSGTLVTDPAGNIFSYTSNPSYYCIYNNASNINYYHHIHNGTLDKWYPLYRYQVAPQPDNVYFSQNACPASLGGEEKSELLSLINYNQIESQLLDIKLDSLIDDSNTNELVETVLEAYPADSSQVYTELLNITPYLSDTVVFQSVINEDAISNSMITNILTSNSHTLKNDEILEAIENKVNQLDDDMYNQVISALDSISGKETIEGEISYHEGLSSDSFKQLIDTYGIDSTSVDTIVNDIENLLFLPAKYYQSLLLFDNGRKDEALQLLESVMSDDLYQKNRKEVQELADFYSVILADSIVLDTVMNFQNSSNEQVKSFARNILIHNKVLKYNEPYDFGSIEKSSRIKRNISKDDVSSSNMYMHIYPNPTNEFVNIIISTNQEKQYTVRVIDLLGVVHIQKTCHKNLLRIDLKNLKTGSYLIQLLTNESILESQIVIKN